MQVFKFAAIEYSSFNPHLTISSHMSTRYASISQSLKIIRRRWSWMSGSALAHARFAQSGQKLHMSTSRSHHTDCTIRVLHFQNHTTSRCSKTLQSHPRTSQPHSLTFEASSYMYIVRFISRTTRSMPLLTSTTMVTIMGTQS